jgi:2-polyprenyl-3-methyl-5-hydroxy-6-metoxy-1,4-benzoquinol methylase
VLRFAAARVVACWPGSRPWFIWLKFKLFGKRISRDQWQATAGDYERLLHLDWDATRRDFPSYFGVLEPAIKQAKGRVLEIGCGLGNMTRWIALAQSVQSVLALDAFETAINKVKEQGLPKVEARVMPAENLALESGRQFDTVYMCEFIEHLYADEEQSLLTKLRPHLAPGARFVISTPVGWMPDPNHVRGFSKRRFVKHLRKYYGNPEAVDFASGYSQLAWGSFNGA